MAISRGSQWGKWDLHVHTPLSFESQYGMSSDEREDITVIPELSSLDTPDRLEPQLWTKYVHELEEVEGINALGITDYFSVEGFKIIQSLREDGYLDNFDVILPNIEFRIDTITGEQNRINVHVIFSEELSIEDIEQEFLHCLDLKLGHSDERTLRTANLERLGRDAIDRYEGAGDLSPYEAGCKYGWVDFHEIIQELETKPSTFEGKYLIVLSGAEWHQIDWFSQDAEIKRQLLERCHSMFSGSLKDRAFAIGEGDLSKEEFEDNFGSLKPVLHGSDAHNFERLCYPDEKKYCWIKANPTFEGLKQVVFEPRDRLHIGPNKPAAYTQIQTIESLHISDGDINRDLKIADSDIPFNSNLISIIGNQGAGKTALLDLIANCFDPRTMEQAGDDNAFISRVESSNPELTTKLSFKGEDIEDFSKQILEEETVEGPSIEYVPQGQIVEYCKKGNKIHNTIRDLVRDSVKRTDQEIILRLEEEEDEISEIAANLRGVNAELHEINPEEVIENLIEEKSGLTEQETLLTNKEEQIAEFKEIHQEQLVETEAEDLQSELDGLRDESEELADYIGDIETALDYLDQIDELNNLLETIQERVDLVESDIVLEKVETSNQEEQLNSLQNEAEAVKDEIGEAIVGIRESLNELGDLDEELSELIDEKRQIEDRISNTEDRIEELEAKREHAQNVFDERIDIFVNYVDHYFDLKKIYSEVADEFSEGEGKVLEDIEFEPRVELTENRTSEMAEILDNRSVNRDQIKPRIEELESIVSGERPENLEEQIREYIDGLEELRENLLDSREPIDFDGIVYDDCLELSEEIYYQGTPMDQLSRGQKGTVLLRIYLAKGENPLIIDTPEENLDNQFVFDELIDAIRDAKIERQILVATHDANLVVNTDSEQIIIAEFEEGVIRFKGGALEDEKVRADAKHILEGGDEAFRLREAKYDLIPS